MHGDLFFPCFSLTIGINFFHVLGIVWISASCENGKKPIALRCLCFPILFAQYGNSLFPYFDNCMDFCFFETDGTNSQFWNVFGIFPILFLYYGILLSTCFGNCKHLSYLGYLKEPNNMKRFVLSQLFFCNMGIHF